MVFYALVFDFHWIFWIIWTKKLQNENQELQCCKNGPKLSEKEENVMQKF